MAKAPTMSLVPPGDDHDDDRLRRALGQSPPPTPAPATPPAPVPVQSVATSTQPSAAPVPPKVTVSVRMAPETQASLAAIGKALGWSSNRIMTALVEHQACVLKAIFEKEGAAGALKLLID